MAAMELQGLLLPAAAADLLLLLLSSLAGLGRGKVRVVGGELGAGVEGEVAEGGGEEEAGRRRRWRWRWRSWLWESVSKVVSQWPAQQLLSHPAFYLQYSFFNARNCVRYFMKYSLKPSLDPISDESSVTIVFADQVFGPFCQISLHVK